MLKEMLGPVFIVGNSRSGTTLMARILSRHRDIHILNEMHFIDEHWKIRGQFELLEKDDIIHIINQMITIQRKDYYRKSELEEYPQETKDIYEEYKKHRMNGYSAFIWAFMCHEAKRKGKSIPGDQTPRHVFAVRELLDLFINGKIIHMVRDPRAITLSQRNKWKAAVRSNQPKFEVWRTRINYHPVTMALLWNKAIDAGLNAQKRFGDNVVKTIMFEELTSNPACVIENVCDFLGIGFYQDMLDIGVSMSSNIIKADGDGIDHTVADRWKGKLSPTEIYLVDRICAKNMQALGYLPRNTMPNPLLILLYLLYWPLQIGIAISFNLSRMGNPVTYLIKRILPNT